MAEAKYKVCVAIPIYKEKIDVYEEISITQVLSVLGDYDIYFFAPKKLKTPKYLMDKKKEGCDFSVVSFDDGFFENTVTYTKLLLSTEFYDWFVEYEYMLIYQLDAFVFSNQIDKFIAYDYDYIGAPWEWECYKNFPVGNGGLSLRKIKRCRELVQNKELIYENNPYKEYFSLGEDVFFSYCGSDKSVDFVTPEPKIACRFAVQDNSYDGIQDIVKNGLPFGIHHFPKWNYYFWKPIIETYGYKYPESEPDGIIDNIEDRFRHKFEEFFISKLWKDEQLRGSVLNDFAIDESVDYSLWGAGREGERIYKLLKSLGINVLHLYDQKAETVEWYDYKVEKPENEVIVKRSNSGEIIVVSSSRYESEIILEIKKMRIKERDYVSYSTFVAKWRMICENYLTRFSGIRGITRHITVDNTYPLVSVVMPCYNIECFLGICLECILNQTYRNIEIICVDDGSTDTTAEIIDAYYKRDQRITLIKQTNQYAGVARNNGLKRAKGKYVLFFDGDDRCEPNMLTEMVASAERHNSDVVVCDVQNYDNLTGIIDGTVTYLNRTVLSKYGEEGVVSYKDIPDQILLLASSGPWNKLYRRDFIEKNGLLFQNSKRDNDEYFVLISMALAERISWVSKKFVTYRTNNPLSLQGFGDEIIDVDDLLSTIRALKEGLIKTGRYDFLKNSMKNQILTRYVSLIEGQRSWKNFKLIFDVVKNKVFHEFEINKMDNSEIQVCPEERKKIMECTAEEYMFWLMKRFHTNGGEKYTFPFAKVKDCKTIGVYGAGRVGKAYCRQIQKSEKISLVGWYDRDAERYKKEGLEVESPDDIIPEIMDKIVIAIESFQSAGQIREFLLRKGFLNENIVWDI